MENVGLDENIVQYDYGDINLQLSLEKGVSGKDKLSVVGFDKRYKQYIAILTIPALEIPDTLSIECLPEVLRLEIVRIIKNFTGIELDLLNY